MPELPFPDDVRALLTKPNPAVVSTLRSDGQPVSVATWYLLEDDDRVGRVIGIARRAFDPATRHRGRTCRPSSAG